MASDSYRLAVRDLVARGGEAASFRALVAAARLQRARTELPGEGDIDLSLTGATLRVAAPSWSADLGVVAAEYPKYESLFGADPDASSFTAQRSGLCELLGPLQEDRGVGVRLSASSVLVGDSPVEVTEPWDGPDMTVVIDPRFFRYAVGSALGPEIRVEITTALKPVLFRSATDGSFICLVMPIKLE